MFWREQVHLSDDNYKICRWVTRFFRLLGLFPIAIRRDHLGRLYMQWSLLYVTYSYSMGIFLHAVTYWGTMTDQTANFSESVRVRSKTDVYVNMVDINFTQIGYFWGVFIMPLRFLTFFQYVRCINEVDEALLTKHMEWETVKEFFRCHGWGLASALIITGDYLMYFYTVGRKLGGLKILKLYFTYYCTCTILFISEYGYQYMGSSLRKRIKRLNEVLENFYLVGSRITDRNGFGPSRKTRYRNMKPVLGNAGLTINNPRARIKVLMKVYLRLVEASRLQNTLLGTTGVVIITVGFWHLLTASYFLLSELSGKRNHPVYVGFKVILGSFHIARLLLIIEPWYGCCLEAEVTKSWVCKLHCSSVGRQLRKKLRAFQMVLGLQTIEFSLADLVVVDRTLFTTVLSTVTTYVVILLQYQQQDTEIAV